jgi:DNA-binding transcriptional ArsR family regulator
MAQKISKDTPLNDLTIRKYEKPYDLNDRELVRKLCLSIGVLQPGDSRDVIVDVLHSVINSKGKELNCEEVKDMVIDYRKKAKLPLLGIASSNVRRQLRRLREVLLIEKRVNLYRINENLSLHEIYKEKIKKYLIPSILDRVEEYIKAADERFKL